MRILGIDPGLASVGWGLIDYPSGGPETVEWGTIQTSKDAPTPLRLCAIHKGIEALVAEIRPDAIAVEGIVFAANTKTAIAVAQARGVILLATAASGVPVAEYTPPMEIKKAVSGRGRAGKSQVQHMVATLLGLANIPRPDHAADALATALCHAHTLKSLRIVSR